MAEDKTNPDKFEGQIFCHESRTKNFELKTKKLKNLSPTSKFLYPIRIHIGSAHFGMPAIHHGFAVFLTVQPGFHYRFYRSIAAGDILHYIISAIAQCHGALNGRGAAR